MLPKSHDILLEKAFSGLSIQRWNNFPRLRPISALDHLAFVAHIGIILILLFESEGIKTFQLGVFLKKVLFSGFFTFQYSDIQSDVKDKIRDMAPDMYKALEDNVYNDILSVEMPAYIVRDIELVKASSEEDRLLAFCKIWASYYEAYNSSLVYTDMYAKTMKHIIKKGEAPQFQEFLRYINFDPHNQNDIERYLLVIHRLASSFRWNRSTRHYPVSVLSHTYLIGFVTYLLANDAWYDEIRITDMILTAFFHDIPEAITGDIITPTKKSVPWLENVIEMIEQDMVYEQLLSYLDGYVFTEMLSRKMLHPWWEPHGDIVKKADMISAYYEARIEAPMSEEFQMITKNIKERIESYKI